MPVIETHRPLLVRPVGLGLVFLLLLLPCYANTFNAAWQLDDRPGIVNNPRLHIDNLLPGTLWDTFFAKPGVARKLNRPVANLTFALNWYLGQDNPAGYHIVNFTIHYLNSLLLYLLILRLLAAPLMRERHRAGDTRFIALFGALLWSLNPIQTQAVTYVVQRMALLAALFYLLGIHCYLTVRFSTARNRRVRYSIAGLLCYLLAVGSKENAIMLPVSLILVEWVFISPSLAVSMARRDIRWVGIAGVAAFILIMIVFTISGRLTFLFAGYGMRPFSVGQRLMTEGRIVLWYLSLIFYPSPFRLSIEHDVQLSGSLFVPWTTLPALLLIGALAAIAIRCRERNHLLSFGILFFLVNQVVESTIIPLELIFEHRNYLSACFLFLPVAAALNSLLNVYRRKNRTIFVLLAACVPLWLILFGAGTHYRNNAWSTRMTLWEDAMYKAPGSARPLVTMADLLAAGENPSREHLDRALGMYLKSLNLRSARKNLRAAVLGNMASILIKKHDLNAAMILYRKSLEKDPEYIQARFNLSTLLSMQGRFEEAMVEIDRILAKGFVHEDYFNLKANIHLWQHQPQAALDLFRKSLQVAVNREKAFIGIGSALSTMDHHHRAEWFFRLAHNRLPHAILIDFLLIDNALAAGDVAMAINWTDRLLESHTLAEIKAWLAQLPTFYQSPPVNVERIRPVIKERINVMSTPMNQISK